MNKTETSTEKLLYKRKELNAKISDLENFKKSAKQVETDLNKSEEKYRGIFESSPLGKSITGVDGTLQINQAFCDMLGYSPEQLYLKHWKEITHPDDVEESQNLVQSLLEGKFERTQFEKRYIHKNGNIIWADVITALKKNSENQPEYFISSIQNITEKKRAEKMLQDEKDSMKTILDLVGNPLFVKDNDHRVIRANNAFYEMFGMNEENVIGFTLAEAVPENERQHFLKVDRIVLDTGIADVREEELTVGENTQTIITKKTRFIDEAGRKFLVGTI